MKKILLLIFNVLLLSVLHAQHRTNVVLDGMNNTYLQQNIEKTLSKFLTACNNASIGGYELDLSDYKMNESTRKTIEMLWRNSPFRCDKTDITQKALKLYTAKEFEVRNIPLIFTNLDDDDKYKEVVLTFDLRGQITSFHIAMAQNIYEDMFRKTNNDVTDLRRRQIVLDYVEQFRTAYNTKDIDFMEKVFSDDALIIVGRVVTVKKENMPAVPKIEYFKKDKKKYLADLRRVFQNNKSIKVDFQDIKVVRHPIKKDWYGVQLLQHYESDHYKDTGYLFLLWDFTSGDDRPQIHVRVWQPDNIKGKPIDEDDIFSMDDVNIY